MSLPWLHNVELRLAKSFVSQRFHHAQLFSGSVGVGKFYLAEQLADALLCQNITSQVSGGTGKLVACGHCKSCGLTKAGTHPDKRLIQANGHSIGVDDIRKISEFMNHSSAQNGNKVAVIENADKMTTASANALLKTLEEPSNRRYLILTTSQPSLLPATVLSRCVKTPIAVTDTHLSQSWLTSLNIPISPALSLFYTQPLLISQWQQLEQLENIEKLYELAINFTQLEDFDNLIVLINKQPELIKIFILFLTQEVKNKLATVNDYDTYQHLQQTLTEFSKNSNQVLGLNLPLAITKLAYCLRKIE
ncbi:DNA polymerase III subunit [Pseudoalteromonas sp. MMG010]|uniref:DNA polymerase III subunit n=1 Tax=Pseudoalteromonas sp. MMG010 TaxID=2822685 RepID=UPI001B39D56F|nr:DNA polymerase III subunit [Pseudoalteromonas sp. MMG010]MBQ4832524.1 DNA polymerase III subunit [Pseudoalteromonas sp. MMG010]